MSEVITMLVVLALGLPALRRMRVQPRSRTARRRSRQEEWGRRVRIRQDSCQCNHV